ncbi:MAG: IS3 family transposase [Actinoallomurus sp.]
MSSAATQPSNEANLWSTLKTELIYWPGTTFPTRTEAGIFGYIDGWYNPRRIQHRLGGLSPDEYEDTFYRRQQDQPDPATIQPAPTRTR